MDPLEVKGILFSHDTDIIEKQVENLIKNKYKTSQRSKQKT